MPSINVEIYKIVSIPRANKTATISQNQIDHTSNIDNKVSEY